jgi:hypothetical protein
MLSFRVGVVKYTVQAQIDGIDRNPPPLTEPATVPSARMHSDFAKSALFELSSTVRSD